MSKRIIVTGSAGIIGFHLSKSLLDDGYEVFGIDNLNDYYDPKLKHARLEQLNRIKISRSKRSISQTENLLQKHLPILNQTRQSTLPLRREYVTVSKTHMPIWMPIWLDF